MATIYMTKVRKTTSGVGQDTHRHIVGVCSSDGTFYTNSQVHQLIDRGDEPRTLAPDGSSAVIKKDLYCPAAHCYHTPYLTTVADKSKPNNLENLPLC